MLLLFSLGAPVYFVRQEDDMTIYAILAFPVIFIAYQLYLFSKRKIAAVYGFTPLQKDNLALYLRSFANDKEMAGSEFLAYLGGPLGLLFNPAMLRTKEENLAVLLKKNNLTLFCIGNPDATKSFPGAQKTSSGNWKEDVIKWMTLAKMIILNAGVTEGTRWEFDQLKEKKLLHKTIILLPSNDKNYYQFKLYFNSISGIGLPEFDNAKECALMFDTHKNIYIIKHTISLFSALPEVALTMKRCIGFVKNGYKITNPDFEVKLGNLTINNQ